MEPTSQTILPGLFPELPDSSRAWLFAAAEPIQAANRETILSDLEPVLSKWKSHGTMVPARGVFLDEVTLLVAADFTGAEMSGCSIDRMIAAAREAGKNTGIDLVDVPAGVHHWGPEGVRFSNRREFGDLVRQGFVDRGTLVLDLTVITLGAVRQGRWKRPAGQGWHAKAFAFEPPAAALA
jgi:hypothetical protein